MANRAPHTHQDWPHLAGLLLADRALTTLDLDGLSGVVHVRCDEVVPDGKRGMSVMATVPVADPIFGGLRALMLAFGQTDEDGRMSLQIESAISPLGGWGSCVISPDAPTRRLLLRVA